MKVNEKKTLIERIKWEIGEIPKQELDTMADCYYFEGINRVLNVLAHHFGLFGRTRDQLRHVHLVLRQGGAHPLNAELLAAVVLLHQPLHFDDRALLGHVHQLIPVPVFAVDVARFIRKGEVEVRAALLIRPRIRRANEQKPDEAGVGFQLIDCHG